MPQMCGKGIHDMSIAGFITAGDGRPRCRACKRRRDLISKTAARKGITLAEAEALMPEPRDEPMTTSRELIDPGYRGTFGRWFDAAISWMEWGLCREEGAPDMFPDGKDRVAVQRAQEVCEGCAMRELCLTYAIENQELQGIWGGMTPWQRKVHQNPQLRETRRQQSRRHYAKRKAERTAA